MAGLSAGGAVGGLVVVAPAAGAGVGAGVGSGVGAGSGSATLAEGANPPCTSEPFGTTASILTESFESLPFFSAMLSLPAYGRFQITNAIVSTPATANSTAERTVERIVAVSQLDRKVATFPATLTPSDSCPAFRSVARYSNLLHAAMLAKNEKSVARIARKNSIQDAKRRQRALIGVRASLRKASERPSAALDKVNTARSSCLLVSRTAVRISATYWSRVSAKAYSPLLHRIRVVLEDVELDPTSYRSTPVLRLPRPDVAGLLHQVEETERASKLGKVESVQVPEAAFHGERVRPSDPAGKPPAVRPLHTGNVDSPDPELPVDILVKPSRIVV